MASGVLRQLRGLPWPRLLLQDASAELGPSWTTSASTFTFSSQGRVLHSCTCSRDPPRPAHTTTAMPAHATSATPAHAASATPEHATSAKPPHATTAMPAHATSITSTTPARATSGIPAHATSAPAVPLSRAPTTIPYQVTPHGCTAQTPPQCHTAVPSHTCAGAPNNCPATTPPRTCTPHVPPNCATHGPSRTCTAPSHSAAPTTSHTCSAYMPLPTTQPACPDLSAFLNDASADVIPSASTGARATASQFFSGCTSQQSNSGRWLPSIEGVAQWTSGITGDTNQRVVSNNGDSTQRTFSTTSYARSLDQSASGASNGFRQWTSGTPGMWRPETQTESRDGGQLRSGESGNQSPCVGSRNGACGNSLDESRALGNGLNSMDVILGQGSVASEFFATATGSLDQRYVRTSGQSLLQLHCLAADLFGTHQQASSCRQSLVHLHSLTCGSRAAQQCDARKGMNSAKNSIGQSSWSSVAPCTSASAVPCELTSIGSVTQQTDLTLSQTSVYPHVLAPTSPSTLAEQSMAGLTLIAPSNPALTLNAPSNSASTLTIAPNSALTWTAPSIVASTSTSAQSMSRQTSLTSMLLSNQDGLANLAMQTSHVSHMLTPHHTRALSTSTAVCFQQQAAAALKPPVQCLDGSRVASSRVAAGSHATSNPGVEYSRCVPGSEGTLNPGVAPTAVTSSFRVTHSSVPHEASMPAPVFAAPEGAVPLPASTSRPVSSHSETPTTAAACHADGTPSVSWPGHSDQASLPPAARQTEDAPTSSAYASLHYRASQVTTSTGAQATQTHALSSGPASSEPLHNQSQGTQQHMQVTRPGCPKAAFASSAEMSLRTSPASEVTTSAGAPATQPSPGPLSSPPQSSVPPDTVPVPRPEALTPAPLSSASPAARSAPTAGGFPVWHADTRTATPFKGSSSPSTAGTEMYSSRLAAAGAASATAEVASPPQEALPTHAFDQGAFLLHTCEQEAFTPHEHEQRPLPSYMCEQEAIPQHTCHQGALPPHTNEQGALPSLTYHQGALSRHTFEPGAQSPRPFPATPSTPRPPTLPKPVQLLPSLYVKPSPPSLEAFLAFQARVAILLKESKLPPTLLLPISEEVQKGKITICDELYEHIRQLAEMQVKYPQLDLPSIVKKNPRGVLAGKIGFLAEGLEKMKAALPSVNMDVFVSCLAYPSSWLANPEQTLLRLGAIHQAFEDVLGIPPPEKFFRARYSSFTNLKPETLRAKLEWLKKFAGKPTAVRLLTFEPHVLSMSFDYLKSQVEQLGAILNVPQARVFFILVRTPKLLSFNVARMAENMAFVGKELGLDQQQVTTMAFRFPTFLTASLSALEGRIHGFETSLEVDRATAAKCFLAVPCLLGYSTACVMSKVAVIQEVLGLDRSEVLALTQRVPQWFTMSVEGLRSRRKIQPAILNITPKQWSKMVIASPSLLNYRTDTLVGKVDYLHQLIQVWHPGCERQDVLSVMIQHHRMMLIDLDSMALKVQLVRYFTERHRDWAQDVKGTTLAQLLKLVVMSPRCLMRAEYLLQTGQASGTDLLRVLRANSNSFTKLQPAFEGWCTADSTFRSILNLFVQQAALRNLPARKAEVMALQAMKIPITSSTYNSWMASQGDGSGTFPSSRNAILSWLRTQRKGGSDANTPVHADPNEEVWAEFT